MRSRFTLVQPDEARILTPAPLDAFRDGAVIEDRPKAERKPLVIRVVLAIWRALFGRHE
jgi:hypothetical protein